MANSVYQDEIRLVTAFHQGLDCVLPQNNLDYCDMIYPGDYNMLPSHYIT